MLLDVMWRDAYDVIGETVFKHKQDDLTKVCKKVLTTLKS